MIASDGRRLAVPGDGSIARRRRHTVVDVY
jgi:hypothetical protein